MKSSFETMTYDLIIIGAGTAGLSAGLLAGRYGLDALIIERQDLGGELVNSHTIETYPGFPGGISGSKLRESIVEQLREYDVDFQLDEVTEVNTGGGITVITETASYDCRTLIFATGERHNPLPCSGGETFDDRGIFYCALCDGALYRDKRVVVVGCGECALMDALYLSDFASEVLVVGSTEEMPASEHVLKQVASATTVTLLRDTELTAVTGNNVVTGIELYDPNSGTVFTEEVEGILPRCGSTPNTEFLPSEAAVSDSGHVVVNTRLETSVSGVFAAGAIREHAVNNVASAAGDGARAFRSALEFLKN